MTPLEARRFYECLRTIVEAGKLKVNKLGADEAFTLGELMGTLVRLATPEP